MKDNESTRLSFTEQFEAGCCSRKTDRFRCPWCILSLFSESRRLSLIERYEERAAIMEFDGGLSRSKAERLAILEVLKGVQIGIV